MATQKSQKVDIIEVQDGRLIVDVALTNGTPSASGKTLVYFSTRGNMPINDGYVVGINLYRRRR
jgi:hypothetical protein